MRTELTVAKIYKGPKQTIRLYLQPWSIISI